jgi:hypothetical protein
MDVVPISFVGIVQDGRGLAKILVAVTGDSPARNTQEMFGRR